eukprot:PhM_4_TR18798/c0_g2_i1/m.77529
MGCAASDNNVDCDTNNVGRHQEQQQQQQPIHQQQKQLFRADSDVNRAVPQLFVPDGSADEVVVVAVDSPPPPAPDLPHTTKHADPSSPLTDVLRTAGSVEPLQHSNNRDAVRGRGNDRADQPPQR